MKITSLIILSTVSLCASLCCPGEDDSFISEIYIENNTVIQIENNQNNFAVGEEIIIDTNILLQQTTTNDIQVELSNYDYSEINQSAYRYTLVLYKLNEFGSISKIPLSESNISSIEGNTFIQNGSLFTEAIFDGISYKSKCSITLAESGTYFLADERFLIDNNGTLNILGGVSEFSFVNITSTIVNANENDGYEFIVN